MSKKTPVTTAPENEGASMPSPFCAGRENEAVRRAELLRASPEVARIRAETEAALAEAERIAEAARSKLQAREEAVEVLRSLLIDERRKVSNASFWSSRPGALEAEIVELESRLVDCALQFSEFENPARWARAVERLAVLREELAQARRVLPLVEADLEAVRKQRAGLQRELGFAVHGIGPDGRLEGEPPEPEPVRFEWQSETPGGSQRFRPVEVA